MGKSFVAGLAVVSTVVAAVSVSALGEMYRRVRAYDQRNRCDVLAGLTPDELWEKQAADREQDAPAASSQTSSVSRVAGRATADDGECETVRQRVVRVDYDGNRELSVCFNREPDASVARQYVRVEPLQSGTCDFRFRKERNFQTNEDQFVLRIFGDFAYQTNVTLRILKEFPPVSEGTASEDGGTLDEDFVYTFRRPCPKPEVRYVDNGRYLPPGGRKVIRVETLSVTNLATSIRRVAPQNIVQLLGRDTGCYRSFWAGRAEGAALEDISGECETGLVRCVNRPCEREIVPFAVSMCDGGPTNGVFLLTVRNGDLPHEEDERWGSTPYNPNLYRLVCLSDLGLSVRSSASGPGVWVTSLMTGRPMPKVSVEVYSLANVLIASGVTDGNGWCVPKRCAKGHPFAVVARTDDDMTFVALHLNMTVDEAYEDGDRPEFLEATETDAFVWTERGIYRHGESIFVHVLARNGLLQAPEPMPLVLTLKTPDGSTFATKTIVTDADGALAYEGFSVPDEQPSGTWRIEVSLPGKDGRLLVEREIKVEEFAPPQVRVSVSADEAQHPTNFVFRVTAEHLFGGPAEQLACEGAVVFEDVPFAPAQWKGFVFGNDQLGLKPSFRRLARDTLNDWGACEFDAPLWADSGRPKAAVRVTGQGVVFEDGGRPATARKSLVCHYYPFYIGSNLPEWLKRPTTGQPSVDLVCVSSKGSLVEGERTLIGRLERVDSVYAYKKGLFGQNTWTCERVRTVVSDRFEIPVRSDGRATCSLPVNACGDYVFTAEDPDTGVSFGRAFYFSDWGDDVVSAPLGNPTEVTIRPDKAFYRVGERPRLVIKSPFTGHALLSVLRKEIVYTEVLNLTNATSEVVLRPVERGWAPNVDVAVSVVQSVAANANRLAARAHGLTTVCVRPVESEIDVRIDAAVNRREKGGSQVTVDIGAVGAKTAVVTLVDEGINLLTGEETPNPVSELSLPRTGWCFLYDMFDRILPVADEKLCVSGVKTGGGFGAEMLGRVSPVPTRRFKPLAKWKTNVELKDGKGRVTFDLPEFVGEVRVTVVAYSAKATGAASVQKKVSPKLVVQPDAPRFVAPGDAFDVTMPIRNVGDAAGKVDYALDAGKTFAGQVSLGKGESTNVVVRLQAPADPGEMTIRYSAVGLGERHEVAIPVPVRPAVAWRDTAGVVRLSPGAKAELPAEGTYDRLRVAVNGSSVAELVSAIEWLSDYPHGCLEQTASRVFPLITAGGILNSVTTRAAVNREEYVKAGVRRVESMIHENDFVMWPDCTYAPWDVEVSLYAAHFLIEAEKAGQKLTPVAKMRVLGFLETWACDARKDVSAYACQTLAIAGCPDKERMFRLYDNRKRLDALSRARLARAFVAIHDRKRAEALMAGAFEPQSVKEAAFLVLALVDLNPDDPRLPALVGYLTEHRDKTRFCWGTTAENAHALLAIGAYLRHHPSKPGEPRVRCSGKDAAGRCFDATLGNREGRTFRSAALSVANVGHVPAFVSWRRQTLPDLTTVTNEANGLFLRRRFLTANGEPADLSNLVRGEMLIAELTITSDVNRVVSDLVIEDLFAGAFEPVHREIAQECFEKSAGKTLVDGWILRKDARDDRMLVYSKKFKLECGQEAKVCYPVRVVTAGDFVLPGPSVEAMYHPELRSACPPLRILVK